MVNDEVALGFHSMSPEDSMDEADFSVLEAGRVGAEFADCSICGYRLSRQFLRIINSKYCCTVCAPD
jgi:hypothetical protein